MKRSVAALLMTAGVMLAAGASAQTMDKVVRVGVTFNRTFYFVDKGVQRGVAYDFGRLMEDKINEKLWEGFSKFSAADWVGRHTAVSEDEFKREPHRNKFTVLLGRTAHMSYHVGQATLARPKA